MPSSIRQGGVEIMRFLGNKESLIDEIHMLLNKVGLLNNRHVFFDAFCGTGAVAESLKERFDLIINDNLNWCTVYSHGRICANSCSFNLLGFDPFEYLNGNNETIHGFIYDNYAPTLTKRMYFTPENAARIDYFRNQIEKWKDDGQLNDDEFAYLMASLIESVSKVSNTAGVYGAFLKKWDARALKPIVLERVDAHNCDALSLSIFSDKIENIIADVDCDILYLDPPYTQNQYGTQYHLLETLILNDNPSISKVTGSRRTAPMRSDWSKQYKANILFDKVLAKTRAKYVLLSYNNDGFMSKEFIEASMKRYGKPDTYICKQVSYKKYQNWKSNNPNQHFEYLFFVELKDKHEVIYESPLNYIGNKAKIIMDIRKYMPQTVDTFIDAFAGGFNVGENICCKSVVCNDLNYFVVDLVEDMRNTDTYEYISKVKKYIQKFGLEKGNEEAYNNARKYYNSLPQDRRDPKLLYAIIMYGFQQQIRFNGRHEFNNPVGVRWFNDKVLEKLISFSRRLKELNVVFSRTDYREAVQNVVGDSFSYFDPPYCLTVGSYNDGKRGFNGWDTRLETELLAFLDELHSKGKQFMLSYVVEHKGVTNERLLEWVKLGAYNLFELGEILGISGSRRKEVLITNYDSI